MSASALDDLLACPVCHAPITSPANSRPACGACGREYGSERGALDLTPVPPPDAAVLERWPLWEQLQQNGEALYDADPERNLSVGERDDAARFAAFCRLSGTVLDVGCGPQVLPSYAIGFDGRLVGIDPLAGIQPRRFAFIKGVAEYLPFRDASFDHVVFATSIDHFLSPALAVREAARVLKPGAAADVWLGELPQAPTLTQRARIAARMVRSGDIRGFLRRAREVAHETAAPAGPPPAVAFDTPQGPIELGVPDGAADPFHFEHPDPETVEGWLRAADLRVTENVRPMPGHCFIRAVRS